jgi:S1-C subfamily serine protease
MIRTTLAIVVMGCLLAACATTPPPCKCPEFNQAPRQDPLAATIAEKEALDLDVLLDSIVQIKVKVSEKMRDGKLEESFEYGTGFFINERGLILTSAHVLSVVDDARFITVYHAGRPLQARPLKVYREVDLATLMVDAGKTKPLVFAASKPRLGEQVFAVGFPYVDVFSDSKPAVSVGHVAGSDREILYEGQSVKDLLLTDAFVADGCSGGPLINEDGQVLGVLRFNLARKGSWLGLSFAEPIKSYLDRKGAAQ